MAWSEEEENASAYCNFDDGFSCQDAENMRFFTDFDDVKSEKNSEEDIVNLLPNGDIVNLLPNDPFGMLDDPSATDFNLSLPRDPFGTDFDTFADITGLIEDLAYGLESDEDSSNGCSNLKVDQDNMINDDCKLFAGLNVVWASSLENPSSYGDCSMLEGEMDGVMCFGSEKYGIEQVKDESSVGVDVIMFVLQNVDLGVANLLSIERVCKSLRDAVQKDPYLWTSIQMEPPLFSLITDDDLLWLTDRARGKLRCLSLMYCLRISIDGLKQVLKRNLELTELSVSGCGKLSGEGLLHNLKLFNSVALHGIKRLRIGDPLGLTNEHLKEYKLLLGEDGDAKPSSYSPRFYRKWEIDLPLDDERAIDIEICPRCQKVEHIFDCPTENCKAKIHSTKSCRGCIFCIDRCVRCGCCFDDTAFEETFGFDFICFDCLGEIILDRVTVPPTHYYVHHVARYHVVLCG